MIPVLLFKTWYTMKQLSSLLILVILITAGMTSCQKENLDVAEAFDLESHTGRYDFNIELETLRDGVKTITEHQSIGYVTKENDHMIKVLFDFAAPKVNCVYEYIVKSDGSFFSTYRGAGERTGKFEETSIVFEETIDLGNGNYKHLDFHGFSALK